MTGADGAPPSELGSSVTKEPLTSAPAVLTSSDLDAGESLTSWSREVLVSERTRDGDGVLGLI